MLVDERVFFKPFVSQRHAGHFLQKADITNGGVVAVSLIYTQEMLEVINHATCQLFDWNILPSLSLLKKLREVLGTALPAEICTVADVASVETLLVLVIDIVEYLDKHLWSFGIAEEMLLDDIGVYDFLLLHEHSVNLADADTDGVEVFVQFEIPF